MFVKDVPEVDPDGHGTAMAGIAMSKAYGVAKQAKAIALGVGDKKGGIIAE